MSLSYEPLWKLLDELKISKMDFAKMIDISNATLAKLGKNEPVTLTIVDKICNRFNCKIENVVRHIPEVSIKTPNFIIKKGMIVLALDIENAKDFEEIKVSTPDGTTHTMYQPRKNPFVVLDIVSPDFDNDPEIIEHTKYENLSYMIAPISMLPSSSPLSVEFNNAIINGKSTDGLVLFGKMKMVNASVFVKLIGEMPDSCMKRFEKILCNLVNAINDIETISE